MTQNQNFKTNSINALIRKNNVSKLNLLNISIKNTFYLKRVIKLKRESNHYNIFTGDIYEN